MSNLRPPAADGNCFYILTDDCAYGNKYFQAGNLCFCSERSYLRNFSEDGPPACFLKVIMLDDSSTVTINLEMLQPVRQDAAGFLLAIGSHSERLDLFLERRRLEGALRAVPGQNVLVEVEREFFPGVVRYIGSIYKPSLAVLAPVFFGVELQVRGWGNPKQGIPSFFHEISVCDIPSRRVFRERGRTEGKATGPTTAPSTSSARGTVGSSCPSAKSSLFPHQAAIMRSRIRENKTRRRWFPSKWEMLSASTWMRFPPKELPWQFTGKGTSGS